MRYDHRRVDAPKPEVLLDAEHPAANAAETAGQADEDEQPSEPLAHAREQDGQQEPGGESERLARKAAGVNRPLHLQAARIGRFRLVAHHDRRSFLSHRWCLLTRSSPRRPSFSGVPAVLSLDSGSSGAPLDLEDYGANQRSTGVWLR